MRALVAESHVVTRVTLTRILERAGFAVEELQDELAAACLISQPDPPELALIATDTLLADFYSVCKLLREARPDAFIVALVPEGRRGELLRTLRSGADDFMIKPATLQEAEARLLVIRQLMAARGLIAAPVLSPDEAPIMRSAPSGPMAALAREIDAIVQREEEEERAALSTRAVQAAPAAEAGGAAPLRDRAIGPEEWSRRHPAETSPVHPAGEPPAMQPPLTAASAGSTGFDAPAGGDGAMGADPGDPGSRLFNQLAEFDFLPSFTTVLEQLELGRGSEIDPATVEFVNAYTAWVPLIVRHEDEAVWINLRMDVDRMSASRLNHVVTKKPSLDEDVLLKLQRDIVGLAQDGLQRELLEGEGISIYAPVLPTALPTDRFPGLMALTSKAGRLRTHALALVRDARVRLSFTVEPITPAQRTLTALRRLDILASPVQTKGDHMMLLRDGILLSDAYIQKIKGFQQSHPLEREVSIFRPPSGIAVFLYHLIDEAA